MAEMGTYRSPTGPNGEYEDHAEWVARKQREAAESKREKGLEQWIAGLERRMKARYSEVIEAMELAFGDLRAELDERIGRERVAYDAEARALEDLRETHETLVGRLVQRATKDASQIFANEFQKLRNQITFLERRIKELEGQVRQR